MPKDKSEEEVLLDQYHDLKVLAQSEGGRILIENNIKDIVSVVSTLAGQYKNLSHIEMIAHCAALNEKLNLVHVLTRAEEAEKELEEQLRA